MIILLHDLVFGPSSWARLQQLEKRVSIAEADLRIAELLATGCAKQHVIGGIGIKRRV
jgi:hypothetical protein